MVNNDYDPMFDAAGQAYNVDPQLLKTIFAVESGGNPNAPRGSSGEIGGMQFMPSTANQMHLVDPADMTQAIPAAAQIIRKGLDANNGNVAAALQTYNGGAGGPNNPKTFNYVLRAQQLYPQMALKSQGQQAQPQAQGADPDVELGKSIAAGETQVTAPRGDDPDVALGKSIVGDMATGQSTPGAISTTTPGVTPVQTSEAPQPAAQTTGGNLLAGVGQGVKDVAGVAAPYVAAGVNALSNLSPIAAIDRAVPALGRLDQQYGQDPSAAIAAGKQAYTDQYGNSLAAGIGRFAGQTAMTLPATGPIGALGESIAAGAGPIAGAVARIGTGAVQGGVAAGMTGGNVDQGAAGGAAMGAVGQGVGAVSNMLQNGGMLANALHSKIADKIAMALGGLGGLHFGDIGGLLAGQAIGPILKQLSEKYGPKMASMLSQALAAGNASGITTGGAGIAAGQLQPINNQQ